MRRPEGPASFVFLFFFLTTQSHEIFGKAIHCDPRHGHWFRQEFKDLLSGSPLLTRAAVSLTVDLHLKAPECFPDHVLSSREALPCKFKTIQCKWAEETSLMVAIFGSGSRPSGATYGWPCREVGRGRVPTLHTNICMSSINKELSN